MAVIMYDEEEKQEEFLRQYGWFKINQALWNHKDCSYDCCLDVAVLVQVGRLDKSKLNKIFRWQ